MRSTRFKVGDKVRFLNEIGDGIIVGFLGKKHALVKVEHDFELPFLLKELLVIEDNNENELKDTATIQLPLEANELKYFKPIEIDPKALVEAMLSKSTVDKKKQSKPHHYLEVDLEVDLHVEELVNSHKHLSNGQILYIQMGRFEQALDNALAKNAKRLIVIHGIGTGKLKSEIHARLKLMPHLKYYDASYSKYGFGATEILLK